jgi:endonuclease YncB( thermonuclease family)
MELASRIVSVALGLAVMVFVLWPITIPVGFGEAWWASRQVSSHAEAPVTAKAISQPQARPASAESALAPQAGAPPAPAPMTGDAASPHAAPPTPEESAERLPTKAEKGQVIAALKEKDATGAVAPQAASKIYYRVTVRDGGSLQSGGVVIRLAGIAAKEAEASCKGEDGKAWPCGAAAKAALTHLIRGRAVTCTLPKSGEHNIFLARCTVGGADLSAWMVRQGWATPGEPGEQALAEAAKAAQAEKLGLWRDAQP